MSNNNEKVPFADEKASADFTAEVHRLLVRELGRRHAKYISNRNFQTFYHGGSWVFQQQKKDGYASCQGEMEPHEHQVSIEVERILANEVALLPEFILQFGEKAEQDLLSGLVREADAAAEASGNTFSIGAAESLADAFLEAVKTTHASIGADGEVSYPSLLLPPALVERLQKEIENKDLEFRARLEEAKRQQGQDARRREEERVAKFGPDA